MTLLKWVFIIGILAASTSCIHRSDNQLKSYSAKWILDDGLCEPETIIKDPVNARLIVSNICGFQKNNKGYLSVLAMDGTLDIPRWIDGLNAPAGMAIRDRKLYVTDLDRVQIIDLDQVKIIDVLGPYPEAKAFNDIAISSDGTVYVSDSARHKVLSLQDGLATPFPDMAAQFTFANGLHIDGTRLYVGGETLWAVDLNTRAIETIESVGLGDIDGIETDGQGGLTVSIVGGNIWHLPIGADPVIWTTPGLSSTNHAYLPDTQLVLVPTGYDNTVIAFQAPR